MISLQGLRKGRAKNAIRLALRIMKLGLGEADSSMMAKVEPEPERE